jgi:hypothetical protein
MHVEIRNYQTLKRPLCQGGFWLFGQVRSEAVGHYLFGRRIIGFCDLWEGPKEKEEQEHHGEYKKAIGSGMFVLNLGYRGIGVGLMHHRGRPFLITDAQQLMGKGLLADAKNGRFIVPSDGVSAALGQIPVDITWLLLPV